MNNLPTRIEVALAASSGVGLGVAAALWGPLVLAFALSQDPIHSGPYLEVIQVLLFLLPLSSGSLLATLVIRRIHYRGERILTWVGLLSLLNLIVVWLIFFGG